MRRIQIFTALVGAAAGAAFLAAATPSSQAAAACTITPQLRAVTTNQGDGAQTRLVRGKKILVRTYWGLPTCAGTGAAIQVTGATLNARNGGTLLRTITAPSANPLGPTYPLIATTVASPIPADASADLKFTIPGTVTTTPSGASSYTLTVDGSLTYQTRPNATTAFSAPATMTWTKPTGSNAAITKPVEKATNALRILVVPMGGPLSADDTSILQNSMSTLCRIFPVPDNSPNGSCTGDLNATAPSGGIRYAVNTGFVDLSAFGTSFCGDGNNFTSIKTQLAGILRAWNSAAGNVPADRVLGVVSTASSVGALTNPLCAEGMASVVSPEAWVRLDPNTAGPVAAMELTHTFGGVPSARSDGGYHSVHTNVDWPSGDADRAFNTLTESFLPNDKSTMRFGTQDWGSSNTLLEAADYAFLLCKLGGTTTSDCTSSNTAGTNVGVAASPPVDTISITGTTDGTPAGTHVLESFQTDSLPTPAEPGSAYRLIQKNASGGVTSDVGIHVATDESVHVGDHEEETTTQPLFSAAVPLANGTTNFVFCKLSGSTCTTLYARGQGSPTITDTSSSSGTFGEPENFTNTVAAPNEFQPAVTKDGSWLAWMRQDGFIYIEPVQGGAVTQVPLPDSPDDPYADATEPAWAPNGQKLAYVLGADIYTVTVDLSGATPTFGTPTRVYDGDVFEGAPAGTHPTWSGDGQKIAFEAGNDIKMIPSSGGTVTSLTSDNNSHLPSWSQRTGDDRIAYVKYPGIEGFDATWTLDPDSPATTQQLLIDNASTPAWGPPGRITFARAGDIWIAKSDGSDATRLVQSGATPSAGQGVVAFFRNSGTGTGEFFTSDIWVVKASDGGGQLVEVESTGADKADFFVDCGGAQHVLAVGVGPDEGGTFSYDVPAGCDGGTVSTRLNNGYSTTPITEIADAEAPDTSPQNPSAAISSLPATVLQYDPIVLDGTGYDYQGGALPGSSLTWSSPLPTGTLPHQNHVVMPAPANGWTPGTYTIQLGVTDGTNTASTTADVTVLPDNDHDNLPAAKDKLSCGPNGASGDNNPMNFIADPDGDGRPNYADIFGGNDVCTPSSSFEGSASAFSPSPFTIPPSLPTTSITGISVPFRDLSQVTASSVKITKIDGHSVSIANTGWSALSGLGSVTFKSSDLAAAFTSLGIANRSVLITLSGSSGLGWSFSLDIAVYVKTS